MGEKRNGGWNEVYDLLEELRGIGEDGEIHALVRNLQRELTLYELGGRSDPSVLRRLRLAFADMIRDSAAGVTDPQTLKQNLEEARGAIKSGRAFRYAPRLSKEGERIEALIARISKRAFCSDAIYEKRNEAVQELRRLRNLIEEASSLRRGARHMLHEGMVEALEAALFSSTYTAFRRVLREVEHGIGQAGQKDGRGAGSKEILHALDYMEHRMSRMQTGIAEAMEDIRSLQEEVEELLDRAGDAAAIGNEAECAALEAAYQSATSQLVMKRNTVVTLSSNYGAYYTLRGLVRQKLSLSGENPLLRRRLEMIFSLRNVRKIEENPAVYESIYKKIEALADGVIEQPITPKPIITQKRTAEPAPLSEFAKEALARKLARERAEAVNTEETALREANLAEG